MMMISALTEHESNSTVKYILQSESGSQSIWQFMFKSIIATILKCQKSFIIVSLIKKWPSVSDTTANCSKISKYIYEPKIKTYLINRKCNTEIEHVLIKKLRVKEDWLWCMSLMV